jgi:hypothetical protein
VTPAIPAGRAVVYVAGPYTHPDPVSNTRRALEVGTLLLDSGHVAPIVPHLSLFWDLHTPRPYRTWLELDLDLISRCDAVLRTPGISAGADIEVQHATAEGIRVFHHVGDVITWAASR